MQHVYCKVVVYRVIVSERPLMYGTVAVVTRPELMLIYVGISVTVSIPSNKVRAVVYFTKNIV